MSERPIESSLKSIHLVKIYDLARGGSGVGKIGEQIIFVPFTMPGDLVEVEITKLEKRYCEGRVMNWVQPSIDRQKPRCSVFGECGGCDWQHIPYPQQWETKKKGVLSLLKKIYPDEGSFPTVEAFPAESIWGYRNRIQLRSLNSSEFKLGFFKKNSHELVSIDRCEISEEPINEKLKELLHTQEVQDQYRGQKLEFDHEVNRSPHPVKVALNQRNAAFGFRQVNDIQNEKLKNWVSNQFTEKGHLIDLYGGSGNLSRAYLSKMQGIECVDLTVPAQKDSPDPRLKFHKSDTKPFLKNALNMEKNKKLNWNYPRFAIMDPPREGLSNAADEILSNLKKLKIQKFILVGCDVDSFVRDVKNILKTGWKCDKIALFDFFPHTTHIESAAVFSLIF